MDELLSPMLKYEGNEFNIYNVQFEYCGLNPFVIIYFRLVCEDISKGEEEVPIVATNLIDVPPVAPTGRLN